MASRAIHLPITTRGVGFCIAHFKSMVHCLFPKQSKDIDYYQLYRLCLALVEWKLRKVRSRTWPTDSYEYSYIEDTIMLYMEVPATVRLIIDSIGIVHHHGVDYEPAMYKDLYEDDDQRVFIPRPENILLSNLRLTVESLSSLETPKIYRKNFFHNNSIPSAVWDEETYILLNPDEIIPKNYNLRTDREHYRCHFYYKLKNEFDIKQIYFNKQAIIHGNKSMFMSNEMGDLHIGNSRATSIIGDIDYFYSFVNLDNILKTKKEEGVFSLLGETPVYDKAKRFYASRQEIISPYSINNPNFHHCQFVIAQRFRKYSSDSSSSD